MTRFSRYWNGFLKGGRGGGRTEKHDLLVNFTCKVNLDGVLYYIIACVLVLSIKAQPYFDNCFCLKILCSPFSTPEGGLQSINFMANRRIVTLHLFPASVSQYDFVTVAMVSTCLLPLARDKCLFSKLKQHLGEVRLCI